jgi:hypothetical protein
MYKHREEPARIRNCEALAFYKKEIGKKHKNVTKSILSTTVDLGPAEMATFLEARD